MSKDAFLAHLRRRWWFVALQAIVVAVVVTAVLAVQDDTSYARTTEFVLHPASTSKTGDVNNSIDVSGQDGPLVQTVLKVLGSSDMLDRAAKAASVVDTTPYSITATVSPGSNYFDVVVEGPDAKVVDKLGLALESVAPAYVQTAWRGFAFDAFGRSTATHESFPPGSDVLLLALVLGAAAAVAELFVVFALRSTPAPARAVAATREPVAVPTPVPVAVRTDRAAAGPSNGNGNGDGDGGRGTEHPVPAKASLARSSRRRRAPAAS
jgi:hypothetical protein